MKAITFEKYGNPGNLLLKEVEMPQPRDNEVLIKVNATSINDWDLGLITGKPFIIRILFGLRKPKINIPGVDVAGIIESVGKNISDFKPGDEVYGDLSASNFGTFAEFVCAKESAIALKPKNMSFEDAAALPHAGMLAVQGLIDTGRIKTGQNILINGAGGGVGTLGIFITRQYKARVTGVDSAEKLEMLKKLGYERVIDYKQNDFTTEKDQYDLILDVKMNRPVVRYARALKRNGRYVTVGGSIPRILAASISAPFIALFRKKYIKVLGLKPNKDLNYISNMYEKKQIKPELDGPYTLEELPRLMKYFAKGKHKGKIIITI